MISLDPPYQVIDAYTLLKDHADPGLFYALPPAPVLKARPDGGPDFSLLQYLGGGAGTQKVAGGLLTFTTELSVPELALSELAGRLEERLGSTAGGSLRVTPAMFDTGRVELVALGAASEPNPAGEGEESPGGSETDPSGASGPFSVTFLGSAKPSLDGRNTCTFQLILDEMAAELVEQALEKPELPIIAIYRMGLVGLRPSFQIDIQADWSKYYRSLQNQADVNFWIVAADAEMTINRTLEESGIRIDTSVFGAGEVERSAAERARKQLVDWVLEHLFEPLADPSAATANAIGQAINDTIWSLGRTVLPGVGYRLRNLNDDQLRTLSARMKEAVAERREIVPQGTMGGMFHRFRVDEQGEPRPGWPEMRNGLIQKVNLESFPRLEVAVAVEDRFVSDGLSEVQVELDRPQVDSGAHRKTMVFRSAAEREVYLVNLLGQEQALLDIPYQYRTLVEFDPSGPFGPQEPLQTEWRTANAPELFVEPREAYLVRDIHVTATPLFPFYAFQAITVELCYEEDGAVPQLGRIELTASQPLATWHYRSRGTAPRAYEYRLTYHRPAQAGGEVVLDWRPAVEDWLSIPDPMPVKRTLNLFFSLPWDQVKLAFLQVRYDDSEHGIRFDEQIDLNPQLSALRRDYPIAEGGLQTIAYRLTVLLKDGQLMEGSWRETEDDRLMVDQRLIMTRTVTVQPMGGSLAENRLSEVKVRLQTREPVSGAVRAESEVRFQPDQASTPFTWEYLLGDPPVSQIFFQGLFIDKDGFVTSLPWVSSEAALVVVNLRHKTIRAA